MKRILVMAILFGVIGVFALISNASDLESIVMDHYYSSKADFHPDPNCKMPSPSACADHLCKRLGTFGCDENSEITQILKACLGNYGSGCVQVACDKLGAFGCKNFNTSINVARSCSGNIDGSCLQSACQKLGPFGCDEEREVTSVANACAGRF